ncbi:thymidylate synthase [Mucilaginibacter sp. McL0603]|uniref:thymidylate synthase n=1 Tax=Mucilaginibacter sp. McL0603 TaxID=3415670 RepID=UPI003CED663E
MAQIFTLNTCFDAWHAVSNMLLINNSGDNLLIEILDPCNYIELDDWIARYSPNLVTNQNKDQINNIINTIFPYKLASRVEDREDLYNRYISIYRRSRRMHNQKWGTYFERLIEFPNSNRLGTTQNQLENAITALNGNSNSKHYITFHLTAANIESNIRPIGAPCWQFGEISKNNNSLDLIAVYRNHDYFHKAFGNYIGLSKLLQYICEQTDYEPGKLVIHSTHAYYNSTTSKFRRLINGGPI